MSSLTRIACYSRLFHCHSGKTHSPVSLARCCSSSVHVFKSHFQSTRSYTSDPPSKNHKDFKWPLHMTMSSEQKAAKEKKIAEMKEEQPPNSLFAKVKYYLKRYWYIAIPAHTVSCTAWFIALYFVVKSGVDVIALLKFLHMPEYIVQKVANTPPSAGVFVVALLLYKLVIPLRYLTTLVLIQGSFSVLRRMGKLRTFREVEYKARTEYEKQKHFYGRRLYRYRNLGVRDVARKNQKKAAAPQSPEKKN